MYFTVVVAKQGLAPKCAGIRLAVIAVVSVDLLMLGYTVSHRGGSTCVHMFPRWRRSRPIIALPRRDLVEFTTVGKYRVVSGVFPRGQAGTCSAFVPRDHPPFGDTSTTRGLPSVELHFFPKPSCCSSSIIINDEEQRPKLSLKSRLCWNSSSRRADLAAGAPAWIASISWMTSTVSVASHTHSVNRDWKIRGPTIFHDERFPSGWWGSNRGRKDERNAFFPRLSIAFLPPTVSIATMILPEWDDEE